MNNTLIFVMKPAAFIWGVFFIGVSLDVCQQAETEQVSSKLHKKAFQDQVERQDHNIHLHHTVISVL